MDLAAFKFGKDAGCKDLLFKRSDAMVLSGVAATVLESSSDEDDKKKKKKKKLKECKKKYKKYFTDPAMVHYDSNGNRKVTMDLAAFKFGKDAECKDLLFKRSDAMVLSGVAATVLESSSDKNDDKKKKLEECKKKYKKYYTDPAMVHYDSNGNREVTKDIAAYMFDKDAECKD